MWLSSFTDFIANEHELFIWLVTGANDGTNKWNY